ncbi:MAG: hypothetical protein AAGF12_21290, partial [Myxococcota bacterium]
MTRSSVVTRLGQPWLLIALIVVGTVASTVVFADDGATRTTQPLFREAPTLRAGLGVPIQLNAVQRIETSGERKLTYNGSFPGPVIRVAPGAQFSVQLVNFLENLTVEDLESFQPSVVGANDSQAVKDFLSSKSAITNLHTHGLHVSPRGRADNVLVKINPGR